MPIHDLFVQHHAPSGDTQHDAIDDAIIVLVHGTPDRSTTFGALLAHLAHHRVVTYDRRGYGRSVAATPPTSMADHAHDLLDLVDALRVEFGAQRRIVVAAHSFGSCPTMLAATLRPDAFASIGLWEPPLVWTDPWPQSTKQYHERVQAATDPAAAVDEIFRTLLGADVWAGTPADVRARRCAEGVAFQVDMVCSMTAPFEFADVTVPTLVGVGTDTSGGHFEGAHWLAEQLPDARLRVVDGVGHFAVRTHPAEYAAFVLAAMDPTDRESISPS